MMNKLKKAPARKVGHCWHWRLPSITVKKALIMFDCLSLASFKHLAFLREAQGEQSTRQKWTTSLARD